MGLLSAQVELGQLLSARAVSWLVIFGHCDVQKKMTVYTQKDGQKRKNDRIQH